MNKADAPKSKTFRTKTASRAKSPARGRATFTKSKIGYNIDAAGRSLVIVESPTKARTLTRYLGANYAVIASGGHIRDLPEKEFGVDIAHGFEPTYVNLPDRLPIVQAMQKAAREAREVLLATDPDREGEAIAWHISQVINHPAKAIKRIQFHEITKRAIEEALHAAGEIDLSKVDAQQARRVLDRLVGYKVSPILWKTVTGRLSAGRVQSVALRLICEREAEIEAFTSVEYWTIDGRFSAKSVEPFLARLVKVDGKKAEIANQEQTDHILSRLKADEYKVESVKKTQRKRSPAPPYITSTLQQDAARRLNFPVKRTMAIAQRLYEGLDIGEKGAVGLITYMRTDSTRVSNEALVAAREFIKTNYSPEHLTPAPRVYKNTKGAVQDAHEAIRPTDVRLKPELVKAYLSPEEYKLYDMIWRRFVATQMKDAEFDVTIVIIEGYTGAIFRASGQIVAYPGFLLVFADIKETEKEAEAKSGRDAEEPPAGALPTGLKAGMPLNLLELMPKQRFTQPPPRFTEAGLVKELDEKGIGRPSTYATIISTLFDRRYIDRLERALAPTDLGKTVNRILVDSFPDIFSVDFTARMETELDRIEEGIRWREVVGDFYAPFSIALENAEGMRRELKKVTLEPVGRKCPDCGAELVFRFGRRGRFIACTGFPKCRYAEPIENEKSADKKVETSDVLCPKCGKPMLVRSGKFGKFLGCSDYPKCKSILPLKTEFACPIEDCQGHLVERRTKTGKVFYGCSEYPRCEFSSWDAPIAGPCPMCQFPTLFEKKTRQGAQRLCRRCDYKETIRNG